MTTFNVHDQNNYRIIGSIDALDEHSALQKAKKKYHQKAPLIESVTNAEARVNMYLQPSSFVRSTYEYTQLSTSGTP